MQPMKTKPFTLLDIFIKDELDKLKTRPIPTRRGTPRGEPIGFPPVKIKAAVLCMRKDVPLQEVAKKVGISYGLLRKWRSEDKFKEEINKCWQYYILRRDQMILSLGKHYIHSLRGYFNQDTDYLTKNTTPMLELGLFSDINDYPVEKVVLMNIMGLPSENLYSRLTDEMLAAFKDVLEDALTRKLIETLIRSELEELEHPIKEVIDPKTTDHGHAHYRRELWHIVRDMLKTQELSEFQTKALIAATHYLEKG